MSGLDLERLVLSGGPLGLMQAAFDYAGKRNFYSEYMSSKCDQLNMFILVNNLESLQARSN